MAPFGQTLSRSSTVMSPKSVAVSTGVHKRCVLLPEGFPLGVAVCAWLVSCREPTQVIVEITTDIKCGDHPSTGIAVAQLKDLATVPFATQTDRCSSETGRIGSIVLIPGPHNDGTLAIRVVAGLTMSADDCVAAEYSGGCVVARRILGFIPKDTLYLPIRLEASCIGVPCGATETCRSGQCVSAKVNADECTNPMGCDVMTPSSGGTAGASGSSSFSKGGGSQGGTSSTESHSAVGGTAALTYSTGGAGETGGSSSGGSEAGTTSAPLGGSTHVTSSLGSGGTMGSETNSTNFGGSASFGGAVSTSGGAGFGGAASTGIGGASSSTGAFGGNGAGGNTATTATTTANTLSVALTEVTRSEYETWLNTGPDPKLQPTYCSWNTTYTPSCEWPPATKANYPVVCVDWCDAYAYCAGIGMRLCGQIGGTHLAFGDYSSASKSQWYNACSSSGLYLYPYGNSSSNTTCNGSKAGFGTTVPVASLTGCHSLAAEFSNVFDMSGNALEWEDSCDGWLDGFDGCRLRGGSFAETSSALTCKADIYTSRSNAFSNFGIRCCSNP